MAIRFWRKGRGPGSGLAAKITFPAAWRG